MEYNRIKKEEVSKMSVTPNLLDYEKTRKDFRWEDISKELDEFDEIIEIKNGNAIKLK